MICLTEHFNKRRELLSIKTLTEIPGGSQILLGTMLLKQDPALKGRDGSI